MFDEKWEFINKGDDVNLFNFQKIISDSFKLRKVDYDNYEILIGTTVVIRLIHCYYVSMGFIEDTLETQKEFFLEDYDGEVKEIDMEELLEQAIREGWWDWKREVAVYKGEAEKKILDGQEERFKQLNNKVEWVEERLKTLGKLNAKN